ncbi:hypothetical protein MHSWG343_07420 [Candidatus Mycoplasma haematohominis]|uniref:Uncharacterized protein n=1 Tax=Candidatus Mycoplasma haematohominis TaxID=1494318 RepID=A0A478FQT8_9MOLU|nr:hypothetical protein MHSWG343_07420 [Candidatus Mycoplasma haemohominis]
MTTQAIGAAAVGAAVIGGGGTLAAYAAGAFSEVKYLDFNDYFVKVFGKEYQLISLDNHSAIEGKIKNATSGNLYKKLLGNHWDNMQEGGFTVTGLSTKPTKGDLEGTDKETEVAKWTKEWCKARKGKKSTAEDKKWTKSIIDADKEWQAFFAVCLEKKSS